MQQVVAGLHMGLFDGLFGGGGGDSNVTQTSKFEPPWFTQSDAYPYWQDVVANAAGIAQMPTQTYGGPTVAPVNDLQMSGINMAADRAINGAPDLNAARGSTMNIAQGGMFANPALFANVSSDRNPFAGSNPFLQTMMDATGRDMTTAFRTGTAAQNDSAAVLGGAYGGSGWQQKQTADAAALAQRIGDMQNQYRMQDYTTQQGLAENAINRDTENAKYNIDKSAGAWDSGVTNMLNASNLTNTLAQDDWKSIQALTGGGDALRSYTQQLYDANRSAFDEQQNAPLQKLDIMLNTLKAASGQGGSNTSSIQTPPMSILGNTLGTAGSLYALSQFMPKG